MNDNNNNYLTIWQVKNICAKLNGKPSLLVPYYCTDIQEQRRVK